MNTKYILLLFIIGILVIYLKKCQKNVEFLSPSGGDDEEMINQIRIENNMNNYLKFKDVQDKIKKDNAISILDSAYSGILNLVRSDDDYETINLIQPILDKIDEIQNEIEEL